MRACVAVTSALQNTPLRAVIRRTWWQDVPPQFFKVFVVGHSDAHALDAENKTHGDMLTTVDSYAHLDVKIFSMISILRSRNPDVYMILDDDTYPRFDRIVPKLSAISDLSHVAYGGVEYYSFTPHRGHFSGWGGGLRHARAVHPKNSSGPFPFLKGPLMVYGSSVMHTLVDDLATATRRQGLLHFKHRIIGDGLMGFLIWSNKRLNQKVKWHNIGVVTSNTNSRRFNGFAEIRWGRNLSAPESCMQNIHFGHNRRGRMAAVSRQGNRIFRENETVMTTPNDVFVTAALLLHENPYCRQHGA